MTNNFSIQTKQLEDAVEAIKAKIEAAKQLQKDETANLKKFQAALATITALNVASIVPDENVVEEPVNVPELEDDQQEPIF